MCNANMNKKAKNDEKYFQPNQIEIDVQNNRLSA